MQPDATRRRRRSKRSSAGTDDGEHVAMVISFSNVARVEQSFTDNQRLLRRKLDAHRADQSAQRHGRGAARAAGLANPGRTSERGTGDVQVAEALPATLLIFSDGGFGAVRDFQLGKQVKPNTRRSAPSQSEPRHRRLHHRTELRSARRATGLRPHSKFGGHRCNRQCRAVHQRHVQRRERS